MMAFLPLVLGVNLVASGTQAEATQASPQTDGLFAPNDDLCVRTGLTTAGCAPPKSDAPAAPVS